ncbi:MAG TPA: response regulator [Lacunisphaera sp.]|nr:response regulator [Lacunisphaera sp.]
MSWPVTTKAGRQLRLLVVDDIEPVRSMIAELLRHRGYEVETAASAEEALQLMQMVRWDGLVLDVDLPDMSGVELYSRILKNSSSERLPVLFFTGRLNETLQLGLGSAPWARLVPKPCSDQQFLAALEQCLQASGEAAPAVGE